MPLFKKQEIKVDDVFIPVWKDSPYCSLANEWDVVTEVCENWNLKLKQAKLKKLLNVCSLCCLRKVKND